MSSLFILILLYFQQSLENDNETLMKKFLEQKEQVKEIYNALDAQDCIIEQNEIELADLLEELDAAARKKRKASDDRKLLVSKSVLTDSCIRRDASTTASSLVSNVSVGVMTDIKDAREQQDASTLTSTQTASIGTMTTKEAPQQRNAGTTTDFLPPTPSVTTVNAYGRKY